MRPPSDRYSSKLTKGQPVMDPRSCFLLSTTIGIRFWGAVVYLKVQFLRRPDRGDPAVDFVEFTRDVFRGLLKQP